MLRRWGTLDLLDMLKHADAFTQFTDQFTSVASREITSRDVLRRRLLLVLFALGTNMGIKHVVDGASDSGETEATLRRVRRLYVNRENLRGAITKLVNATLHVRQEALWGEGTACASDSKKFGSWSSNMMTEWHARYGGPGVMIYWHVERKSLCIYSQLRSCSASEVAAMLEGPLRQQTDADIDRNYTDTHGASIVGFAFCHLLGFRLMPRLKRIGAARLYRPGTPDRRSMGRAGTRDLIPPDRLGADRSTVRPARQVRHRAEARHRRSRTGPAALHSRRPQASDVPSPRRTRGSTNGSVTSGHFVRLGARGFAGDDPGQVVSASFAAFAGRGWRCP